MTRVISIELPDEVTVNGMTDAPESLRVIPTTKWDGDFCLTALIHGVSQKQGDTWSVSKKDIIKTQAVHDNLVAGDWARRAQGGVSEAKILAGVAKLDIKALLAAMTPAQHAAILAAGGDITAADRVK